MKPPPEEVRWWTCDSFLPDSGDNCPFKALTLKELGAHRRADEHWMSNELSAECFAKSGPRCLRQFGMSVFRHHCRQCGALACHVCAPQLSGESSDERRCQECREERPLRTPRPETSVSFLGMSRKHAGGDRPSLS